MDNQLAEMILTELKETRQLMRRLAMAVVDALQSEESDNERPESTPCGG